MEQTCGDLRGVAAAHRIAGSASGSNKLWKALPCLRYLPVPVQTAQAGPGGLCALHVGGFSSACRQGPPPAPRPWDRRQPLPGISSSPEPSLSAAASAG